MIGVTLALVVLMLLAARPDADAFAASESALPVHIFWQEGCPYCAEAKSELAALSDRHPRIRLNEIEVGSATEADALFAKTLSYFGYERAAVPLVVIGDRSYLGFSAGGRSAGLYQKAVQRCLRQACPDVVATILDRTPEGGTISQDASQRSDKKPVPEILTQTIQVPIIGELRPADLSLAALTVVLAAIDGFNPCAMWVLVFLIGLLLGLKDERRMWLLGGAFLGTTAVMYFAVMAAWLNVILLLGVAVWVRLAVGSLAVGGGFYFLREYWTQPAGTCRVTSPNRRQKIMDAFRSAVSGDQLVLSVLGIIGLAIMVNFIELLCSAGIPAVYAQVLALNDLPAIHYYGYLCLYIAVFMLDDLAIFATAMIAVRVAGLTGAYARFSHLIGGIVLIAIGATLLLRPELLAFS